MSTKESKFDAIGEMPLIRDIDYLYWDSTSETCKRFSILSQCVKHPQTAWIILVHIGITYHVTVS